MIYTRVSTSKEANDYCTSDIEIAATLLCKGYQLAKILPLRGVKVTFVFVAHPSLEDAVEGFWNNRIEVHPLEFATYRKNLKSQVYALNASNRLNQ